MRLSFIRSLWAGNLVYDVEKIHKRYGPVVRTAPDEISSALPDAWQDIYATRPGHNPFPKNPVWWSAQPGQADNLITVQKSEDHLRMRRLLNHGFTEAAVREQEPIVQQHMLKLVERMTELALKEPIKDGVVMDIVKWLNFTTFDIVGDLAYGDSFGCLENSQYHPWVAMIFNHFKASALVASVRFYPLLESILMRLLPESIMKKQRDHHQQIIDRVDRRMNFEVAKPDFMLMLSVTM